MWKGGFAVGWGGLDTLGPEKGGVVAGRGDEVGVVARVLGSRLQAPGSKLQAPRS